MSLLKRSRRDSEIRFLPKDHKKQGPFVAIVLVMSALVVGSAVAMWALRPVELQYVATAQQKEVGGEDVLTDAAHMEEVNAVSDTKEDTLSFLKEERAPRIIDALSIADVVPKAGKFLAADLDNMNMQLYSDGDKIAEYPLLSIGRPGTHWETPSGLYSIRTKEPVHFSSIGKVYMPYSMQFFGNYFIHGRTYYPDGTPTASTFSGGCIRLETEHAEKVFEFAEFGTPVFVYDQLEDSASTVLALQDPVAPSLDAEAYLVADLDTGDVYAEHNASKQLPIASITKLMTALVANETISYNRHVTVPAGALETTAGTNGYQQLFVAENLMHPLLMSSNDHVANAFSSYLGTDRFVGWMNDAAEAYNMSATTFVDAAGSSLENISTTDDLFRLAWYIKNKKSFAFNITNEKEAQITAVDGSRYTITNINDPAFEEPFIGGKAGLGTGKTDAMLSLLELTVDGEDRRVVLAVLGSNDRSGDTKALAEWIGASAQSGSTSAAACVTCAVPQYRKIELP